MSVVDGQALKAFGNNVNQSMYLHHWMVLALRRVASHWFWARPNLNETVKLILLWQFLPDFPGLPALRVLPDALSREFMAAARKAGDYPMESEDYHRGEKISRNAYIPVELKRVLFVIADRATCSMSYVINAALRSYLLAGTVPGQSEQFKALRQYQPDLQTVLSTAIHGPRTRSMTSGTLNTGQCVLTDGTPVDEAMTALEQSFLQRSVSPKTSNSSAEGGETQTVTRKDGFVSAKKTLEKPKKQKKAKNPENQKNEKKQKKQETRQNPLGVEPTPLTATRRVL